MCSCFTTLPVRRRGSRSVWADQSYRWLPGDIVLRTIRPVSQVTIHDAPMVFVGYGVAAPERAWDDFKGYDLHGKVAIFLVNDPHFEASPGEPAARHFGGPAMTYYGRWTYKFEEAARRGAIAALVIHETAAAGYDWKVASGTAVGSYDIVRSAEDAQPVLLQAWIARESAVTLFTKAGLDFEALKRKSRDPDFRPVELGAARFSIEMPVKTERVQTHNVLAKLPGIGHIQTKSSCSVRTGTPMESARRMLEVRQSGAAQMMTGLASPACSNWRVPSRGGRGRNALSSSRRGRPRRRAFSDQRRLQSAHYSR